MPGKTRKEEKIIRRLSFLSIVCLVFFADRISKTFFASFLMPGDSVPVISQVFHVTLVHNTGMAFGLLAGAPKILLVISAAILAGLVAFFRRSSLAWALVIGGALGNLYDRLRFGYVVDFLDFRIWPVFNLADSCICVGMALIVWSLFKKNASRSV